MVESSEEERAGLVFQISQSLTGLAGCAVCLLDRFPGGSAVRRPSDHGSSNSAAYRGDVLQSALPEALHLRAAGADLAEPAACGDLGRGRTFLSPSRDRLG